MSSGIARLSGWAGVLAAVMYLLAGILALAAPSQGIFDSFSNYYLSGIILVVAFAVTLVVVAGLHSRHGADGPHVRVQVHALAERDVYA